MGIKIKKYLTSLHFRFVLIIAVSVLPLSLLVLIKSVQDASNDLEENKKTAIEMADFTAVNVSEMIATTHELLTALICDNSVQQWDLEACNERFALIKKHSPQPYANIGMTDENGIVVASAVPMSGKDINVRDQQWWQNLQKLSNVDDIAIGNYETSPVTSTPTFIIGHPVLNSSVDRPMRGVCVALSLQQFADCLVLDEPFPDSVIFVVDSQGIELARNPNGSLYAGKRIDLYRSGELRTFHEMKGIDGVTRLYAFIEVPNSGQRLLVGVGLSKYYAFSESRRILLWNLIWLFLSVMVAAILSWLSSRHVLRHLSQLARSSIEFAKGDWNMRVEPGGGRELQQVGEAFNYMALTLQQEHDRLLANEADLENQVSARTAELQDANEELKWSNEELQKFAYIVSHDLKAPLRAISNLIVWIVEDIHAKKDVSKYINLLCKRTTRMEDLIEGLLEYSRVGRMHTEMVDVDTNDIIEKLKEDYPSNATRVIVGSTLPTVRANKMRLGQVFANLIGNGFKHHNDPNNAIINISCSEDLDKYIFCIADNGPGIDSRFHKKIFEMFQTLKPKDELESTGIGLTIVKKIIEDMDGEIWVESSLGQGAKFYFSVLK